MIFIDEKKGSKDDFVSKGSKEFIESMIKDCSDPYIIYCFNDSKSCQDILRNYFFKDDNVTIKTTKEIKDKISSSFDNYIVLDIGIVPFDLFVFAEGIGYFLLYRNKFFGAYFDDAPESKAIINSIFDKVEKISKMG